MNEYAEPAELQSIGVKVDMVNTPPHYTASRIECIDAIECATEGLNGMESYCTGTAIKYLWRWKRKNGREDLEKAIWYINRLLSQLEQE